jgi:ATP-dependent helicase/nuclease subunit A
MISVDRIDGSDGDADAAAAPDADGSRSSGSSDSSFSDSRSTDGFLPANVYGTVVHRLCEISPPEDERTEFVKQVIHEEQYKGVRIPEELALDEVVRNATADAGRAREQVDRVLADKTVRARLDEYSLDVEIEDVDTDAFETIALRGEIDHLAVTDDTYYLFDYKTDRSNESDPDAFIAERMDHHRPQMLAYASALRTADPDREVVVHLVFTDLDGRVGRLEHVEDPIAELVTLLASQVPRGEDE